MPGTGEVHGDTSVGRRGGHLVIAHGAAGVHDRFHSRGGQRLEPVREGEERIGGRDRAAHPVTAAFDGQPRGDLYARWGVLGLGVALADGKRDFHLLHARRWYDAQPDLLPADAAVP